MIIEGSEIAYEIMLEYKKRDKVQALYQEAKRKQKERKEKE